MATKQRESELAAQYGVTMGASVQTATVEEEPEDEAEDDPPLRGAVAQMMQQMESRMALFEARVLTTANASPVIHNHIAPAEVKAEINVPAQAAPVVNVPAAEVRVDVPAPVVNVEVAAPEVRVDVAAPEVTLEANLPPAEVTVNLPARKTESVVERDAGGRIVKTTQIERDLEGAD